MLNCMLITEMRILSCVFPDCSLFFYFHVFVLYLAYERLKLSLVMSPSVAFNISGEDTPIYNTLRSEVIIRMSLH